MRSLFRSPKTRKVTPRHDSRRSCCDAPGVRTRHGRLMECGHAMMVVHTLNSAARQAARYGSTEAITTLQTTTRATTIVQNSVGVAPTVLVKDGSVLTPTNVSPETIDYTTLPNIELNTTKSDDKLFIVRISVPYDSAAILPPFWIKGITLTWPGCDASRVARVIPGEPAHTRPCSDVHHFHRPFAAARPLRSKLAVVHARVCRDHVSGHRVGALAQHGLRNGDRRAFRGNVWRPRTSTPLCC